MISQLEKSIDAEAALDSVALPAPPPPATATVTVLPSEGAELPSGTKADADASASAVRAEVDGDAVSAASDGDAAVTSKLCQVMSSPVNSTVLVLYDASQLEKYWNERGLCHLDDAEALKVVAEAVPQSGGPKPSPESPAKPVDQTSLDAALVTASDAETNATATSSSPAAPDAANVNAIKANTTPAATTVHVPLSGGTGASPQGLGRLESIFVRITKKSACPCLLMRVERW